MEYVWIYLLIVNLVGFCIMGIDKSKAKKQRWRISEKALFTTALVGGSVGVKLGMEFFRHKTHHKQFIYGIPLIILLQLGLAIYLIFFR